MLATPHIQVHEEPTQPVQYTAKTFLVTGWLKIYTFSMTILFVQTGGTIDKDYPENDDNHGYTFSVGEPSFLRTLQRADPDFSYKMATVVKKDSLDLTDQDRADIRQALLDAKEDRIVVTHGTDTIHKTAAEIADVKGKTIILTGARLPEKFYDSEADFNLGMAVAGAQVLPPGIYIALYGVLVPAAEFNNK